MTSKTKRLTSLLCSFLLFTILLAQNSAGNILDLEIVPNFFKPPIDGNISEPRGVAINSRGHIFIFNTGNLQLMEFDYEGNFIRALGHGMFGNPHGLRIDRDDNIWTTDLETHMVLKFSPDGLLLMGSWSKGSERFKK